MMLTTTTKASETMKTETTLWGSVYGIRATSNVLHRLASAVDDSLLVALDEALQRLTNEQLAAARNEDVIKLSPSGDRLWIYRPGKKRPYLNIGPKKEKTVFQIQGELIAEALEAARKEGRREALGIVVGHREAIEDQEPSDPGCVLQCLLAIERELRGDE